MSNSSQLGQKVVLMGERAFKEHKIGVAFKKDAHPYVSRQFDKLLSEISLGDTFGARGLVVEEEVFIGTTPDAEGDNARVKFLKVRLGPGKEFWMHPDHIAAEKVS